MKRYILGLLLSSAFVHGMEDHHEYVHIKSLDFLLTQTMTPAEVQAAIIAATARYDATKADWKAAFELGIDA